MTTTGNENALLEMIIQAGAVGISILLIAYSAWKDKIYNKTLSNHLVHFTDALDRNSSVIAQNAQMYGALNECQRQTMKLLERVENKLDSTK